MLNVVTPYPAKSSHHSPHHHRDAVSLTRCITQMYYIWARQSGSCREDFQIKTTEITTKKEQLLLFAHSLTITKILTTI